MQPCRQRLSSDIVFQEYFTEPLNEVQGTEETKVGPEEDFPSGNVHAHVDVIVGSQTDPCNSETKDCTTKRQNTGSFSLSSSAERSVVKVFSAETSHNTEENERDDPAESLVVVNELVPEQGNEKRNDGDDNNTDNEGAASVGKSSNNLSSDD